MQETNRPLRKTRAISAKEKIILLFLFQRFQRREQREDCLSISRRWQEGSDEENIIFFYLFLLLFHFNFFFSATNLQERKILSVKTLAVFCLCSALTVLAEQIRKKHHDLWPVWPFSFFQDGHSEINWREKKQSKSKTPLLFTFGHCSLQILGNTVLWCNFKYHQIVQRYWFFLMYFPHNSLIFMSF